MITTKNISFSIGGKSILDQIEVAFPPGKVIGLAGINGAGKSTLLKILSGQIKNYQGEVCINNQSLKAFSQIDLAKTRAVLPQEVKTIFSVPGRSIVEMGRLFFNESQKIKDTVFNEVVVQVKCAHLLPQNYETMSGGEKQKIQLARVLAQIWLGNYPRYLFLDEPVSSLDIAVQLEVMMLLRQIVSLNIGVIVILHDINLMLQYCDEVYFLKQGKVHFKSSKSEWQITDSLTEVFNVPFNIIKNEIRSWIVPN
jgi:iron complex transport system ATP-binding protein